MEIFTKILFTVKNLIARLMKEVPVCDASLIPLHGEVKRSYNNLVLVWLTIHPAYRQIAFKSITVSKCLIYPAELNNKDGILYYTPRTSQGGLKELPLNQILPSRFSATSPLKVAFFVEPNPNQDWLKITAHSYHWFMSTSCEVYIRQ